MTSNNITIDGNILLKAYPRLITALDAFVDPNGGLIVCGYNYPDFCTGITVINNIAAGINYAGIAAMAR